MVGCVDVVGGGVAVFGFWRVWWCFLTDLNKNFHNFPLNYCRKVFLSIPLPLKVEVSAAPPVGWAYLSVWSVN